MQAKYAENMNLSISIVIISIFLMMENSIRNRKTTEEAESFVSSLTTINMEPKFAHTIGGELMRHRIRQNAQFSKKKTMNNFFKQRKILVDTIKKMHKNKVLTAKQNERILNNNKKFIMDQRNNQEFQQKKPHRIYLSNISNLDQLRKTFNCSRSKLKDQKICFERQIGKTYMEFDDNINREIKKADLGYNLCLF